MKNDGVPSIVVRKEKIDKTLIKIKSKLKH